MERLLSKLLRLSTCYIEDNVMSQLYLETGLRTCLTIAFTPTWSQDTWKCSNDTIENIFHLDRAGEKIGSANREQTGAIYLTIIAVSTGSRLLCSEGFPVCCDCFLGNTNNL